MPASCQLELARSHGARYGGVDGLLTPKKCVLLAAVGPPLVRILRLEC
jgi:hypothetical protein